MADISAKIGADITAASENPGEYVLGLTVIKSILKKLDKIVPADLDRMISSRMKRKGTEMN